MFVLGDLFCVFCFCSLGLICYISLQVTDILYYHEDLINDFLRFFEKNDPIASASLLLEL